MRFFIFAEQPDRQQMVVAQASLALPLPNPQAHRERIDRPAVIGRALRGRRPMRRRQLARKMLAVGEVSGVEDLLWSLLLHPEMQYLN